MCLWVVVLLVSSWSVWSCFARLYVGFSLPCRLCFGSVLILGPREVIEALWNTCCAAAVATGLTGSVHRSDRRRPSVGLVQHRKQAVQFSTVRVGEFWLRRLFVGS
jgi:hypothetical protein